MTIKEKMCRCQDLRFLRECYAEHLDQPDDFHANHIFVKTRNFCLAQWGEGEVLRSLEEVNRKRKEASRV